MRAFTIFALAAAAFAAFIPAASAAELDAGESCRPGTIWDGNRCGVKARRAYTPPAYQAETEVVEVAPPPVYVAPAYAYAPAVGVYVGPGYWGPRYGWGGGYWRYNSWGHRHWAHNHHHHQWRGDRHWGRGGHNQPPRHAQVRHHGGGRR